MKSTFRAPNIPRRLPYRLFDKVAIVLALLTLMAMGIFLAVQYPHLPERIPTHYGFNGKVDGWGGKGTIWLLYGIHALVILSLVVSNHFPALFNRPQWLGERHAVPFCYLSRRLMSVLILLTSVLFAFLQINPGTPIDARLMVVVLIVFLLGTVAAIVWYYVMLIKLKHY